MIADSLDSKANIKMKIVRIYFIDRNFLPCNKEIKITNPKEGDIVAILVSGGYGSAMSSNYNMRPFGSEVLVKNKEIILIKRRQTYQEMMSLFEDFI